MAEGPYQIRPEHTSGDYFPNFIEEFVDAKKVGPIHPTQWFSDSIQCLLTWPSLTGIWCQLAEIAYP